MKIPRLVVAAMIGACVLSFLLVAGWWWYATPPLTAERFVAAITPSEDPISSDFRPRPWYEVPHELIDLLEDCPGAEDIVNRVLDHNPLGIKSRVNLEPRTTWDVILGRQRIKLLGEQVTARHNRVSFPGSADKPRLGRANDGSQFELEILSPPIVDLHVRPGPKFFWTIEGMTNREGDSPSIVVFGGILDGAKVKIAKDGHFALTVRARGGWITAEAIDEGQIPHRTVESMRAFERHNEEMGQLRILMSGR